MHQRIGQNQGSLSIVNQASTPMEFEWKQRSPIQSKKSPHRQSIPVQGLPAHPFRSTAETAVQIKGISARRSGPNSQCFDYSFQFKAPKGPNKPSSERRISSQSRHCRNTTKGHADSFQLVSALINQGPVQWSSRRRSNPQHCHSFRQAPRITDPVVQSDH